MYVLRVIYRKLQTAEQEVVLEAALPPTVTVNDIIVLHFQLHRNTETVQ